MPRKGPTLKRPFVVGPVYSSPVITQLVSHILLDDKKSTAERIIYGALEGVHSETGQDPVSVFKRAPDNIRPTLEVRFYRAGGVVYQMPVEVRPGRATILVLRWLADFFRQRRENTITERLMNKILDTPNDLGATVKCREGMHCMIESNKASVHYR